MSDPFDLLRQRAQAGDASAQLLLAQKYLIAHDAPYQPDEALHLITRAGESGHTGALLFHATLAALGFGRKQDFEGAVDLVRQAAALGDAEANGQLRALGGKFDRAAWFGPVQLRQHHAAPRVFTVENFLPASACEWLIERSKRRLQTVTVRDQATGQYAPHPGRTNSAAGSHGLEPDLVMQLTNLRVGGALQTPTAQQEPTNILHYAPGQQYKPHYDFVTAQEEQAFKAELETVGQRVATVLIYLNDDYEGGETEFPRLNWAFKGKRGDALIFWNVSATGAREANSLHAGRPVTSGEKWLLSKWVREKPVPLI